MNVSHLSFSLVDGANNISGLPSWLVSTRLLIFPLIIISLVLDTTFLKRTSSLDPSPS